MPTPTKTQVVKVTGVPEELLRLLDDQVAKRHYAGRSEYVRELIRKDLLSGAAPSSLPAFGAKSVSEAEAVFARIEARDTANIRPLAQGADSRDAIYADRA